MAALDGSAPLTTGRRRALDPKPRFKDERHTQLDVIHGCPELALPDDHLARGVWALVQEFDLSQVEAEYSSLGRRGFPPRRLLALWIYASLVGEHHGSKVARRCQTDMAMRWLTGGHCPSQRTVRRFRKTNTELFEAALVRTVELAHERGLLDLEDLAGDSARFRAHAATDQVRTKKRSRERLEELEAEDLCGASKERKQLVENKRRKHQLALKLCEEQDRSNVVLTNPTAGLMKFPHGASLPGHRLSVMVSGVTSRFVIGVLIDASTHDYGKVEELTEKTIELLSQVEGLEYDSLNAVFDAGYATARDFEYLEQSEVLDGVIAPPPNHKPNKGMFGREHFVILDNAPPQCPAGRDMKGPYTRPSGEEEWLGVGCRDCNLKPKCTKAKRRGLLINRPLERARARFGDPEVKKRYNRRVATVEPVFSSIEDVMRFRRLSSRHPDTVYAELLLKVLAHNVSRLLHSFRLELLQISFWPTL